MIKQRPHCGDVNCLMQKDGVCIGLDVADEKCKFRKDIRKMAPEEIEAYTTEAWRIGYTAATPDRIERWQEIGERILRLWEFDHGSVGGK